MTDGERILTIPRHNPVNAITMGRIVRDAGLTQRRVSQIVLASPAFMRILGIDPGLNTTGYGVIDVVGRTPRLVEAGVIRGGRKSLPDRLAEMHRGVAEVVAALKPEVMAIEQLYSHYARPRTAILMGHARGVIILAAVEAGIPVAHYAATQIKSTLTGNGRAPKPQMQLAVTRELNLTQVPEPPDVADALAIALCHGFKSTQPSARSCQPN